MELAWHLYIDESGRFQDIDDTCVVVGVLVRAPVQTHEHRLRAAIEAAYPGTLYPPHASAIQYLSGRVAAMAARGAAGTVDSLASEALAQLDASGSQAAVALRDAIDRDREPDHRVLRDCDQLLRTRAPDLADRLRALVAEDQDRMRQVIGSAHAALGAEPDQAFVVASVDPGTGDDTITDPIVESDRYLALLAVLIERALALLAKRVKRGERLWVTVARRGVVRRDVGRFPLTIQNVTAAATTAARLVLLMREVTPRVVPAAVLPYDKDAPPGIVLADFISNRLRTILRRTGAMTWGGLDGLTRIAWVMPMHARPGFVSIDSLPAIASSGPPHEQIWKAFAGEPPAGLLVGMPLWAQEQASAWCIAAAKWFAS